MHYAATQVHTAHPPNVNIVRETTERGLVKMASPGSADLEATLLSFERLDRASPELWPEQIPGVSNFADIKSPFNNANSPPWEADLEQNDIDMLNELGSLTTSNLMEKVKGLQNLAYQLGLEEAREMTRGKFLDVLSGSNKNKKK
ncbi:protein lin-52 homolog [Strongylocentrotus purpuratus]|uniref:Protein lin-52 homolog n=1 Tax=Strongylocentrotus purpuratus TaxID=7668 RepID=A0A7M7HEY1_STRPU|nr:protein lin-52 homolog [Strongylocentrotus purpuratus]